MKEIEKRWKRIRNYLEDKKADVFIVSDPHNIRYLACPEMRSHLPIPFLLIPRSEEPIAIVPHADLERVKDKTPIPEILIYSTVSFNGVNAEKPEELMKKVLAEKKLSFVLCDRTLSKFKVEGKVDDFIETMRAIKDQYEIECLKTAQKITIEAAKKLKDIIEEGKTELQIANELDYTMRKLGASHVHFDTIIASGKHSAYAHHQPSKKK